MDKAKLAVVIRETSEQVLDGKAQANDVAELLLVLARILEGKDPAKAFGAPGDWGYSHPIGQALAGR